jgi:integrase
MRAEDKARRKGQGHIFKRGSMYYVRFSINGKRKTISLHTSNKEVAEKNAKTYLPVVNAETKEELAAHVAVAKKLKNSNKTLPLNIAWNMFESNSLRPELKESTIACYKKAWEMFMDFVNVEFVGQIDKDIAEQFANKLWNNKVSASTFNTYTGCLRKIIGCLLKDAGLEENPFIGIPRKKRNTEKHQRLSDEQFRQVLDVLDNPIAHSCYVKNIEEVKVLIFLGAFTGLRLIDCCLMEMSSIDFKKQTIRVKTQKTGATVLLPIAPSLLKILKPLKNQTDKYLLPTLTKRYLKDRGSVSATVAKVFIAAGLDTINVTDPQKRQRQRNSNKYGFHSLRHTFISWCARAGVPLSIVQSIVGHFSQEMTQYYIHITDEERKVIINALPDI